MQVEYREAVAELVTLRDVLRWGASQFNHAKLCFGHGTDNAWDEALQLALHVLHLPYDMDPDLLDARVTRLERQHIIQLFEQRVTQRIPAPYLTQRAYFAGLEFFVDERVLIPRSPIAELIEQQFTPWIQPEAVNNILDLCTGSGCIAIASALYFPHAKVHGTDISSDALAVAQINVEKHHVQQQVTFYESDLFQGLPKQRYDIIVSNPPYVDAEDMADLPEEFHHEPPLGLAAGSDGLALVHPLLKQAKDYLTETGILIVEVGNSADALIDAYPQVPFTWLEFERGGSGVFLLTADQVAKID